jgi:ABC-type dipeptide/oligopeptide/nickel transport system permease component
LITYIGLQLGWLLGGTIIVEVVFGIPGIGLLAVSSAGVKDVATVQAVVVVVAIGYVLLNLLADLAVYALDPRIRTAT